MAVLSAVDRVASGTSQQLKSSVLVTVLQQRQGHVWMPAVPSKGHALGASARYVYLVTPHHVAHIAPAGCEVLGTISQPRHVQLYTLLTLYAAAEGLP
jgi:hypothetical protein